MGDSLGSTLRDRLSEHSEIAAAWLFGSRARSDHREASDVDLGILLGSRPQRLAELPGDLVDDIEEATGLRVDLVVLDGAPADLVHRVLRDGELLVDHDPGARVAFEVKKQNEYWDLVPMMRLTRHLPPGVAP